MKSVKAQVRDLAFDQAEGQVYSQIADHTWNDIWVAVGMRPVSNVRKNLMGQVWSR